MKKIIFLLLLFNGLFFNNIFSKNYLISTNNTSLLLSIDKGRPVRYLYYGVRINEDEIANLGNAGLIIDDLTYSTFGINSPGEKAILATMGDGNMSLDLVADKVEQLSEKNGETTIITMNDKVYPFSVKQFFKAYNGCDVISTWTEISNNTKKPVMLYRFASIDLPLRRTMDNYITHFHGSAQSENTMEEGKLTNGQKIIANNEGIRNNQQDSPCFMMSFNGMPSENSGDVFGGTLAWGGPFKIKIIASNSKVNVIAGMNEDNSQYKLESKETLKTPEFAMTYSNEGKGGVSRSFHTWARDYKIHQANIKRDILLNSWEGVYMNVNQEKMNQMMSDFSKLGGELFVMDDGWFGNKYPRDNSSALGDWEVCRKKLPDGIDGLIKLSKEKNIKFGIWIEPEMVNTRSELYEKHPDWVLHQDNRPLTKGRGNTQVTLDMTNPKVQDFVVGVVDNLLTKHPEIAYIKWDANAPICNYGSTYLPKDKQSHIYIDYYRGLDNTLKRIRAKYPKLVMQVCASGGGRINYGLLPYFEEFWTSDNTDAYERIFMQWGVSNFFPAIAMAAHVSASVSHQAGRAIPIKYRFDVAMSGRLGMELQPQSMNDQEKEFAKRAIESYKSIRDIVQFGDLYRLVSPYDRKHVSSLMYTTKDKSKAVVFMYEMELFVNSIKPVIKLDGVDATKKYKIRDLTPLNINKKNRLDGKIISGNVLKNIGISSNIFLNNKVKYSSLVLGLEEVK